LGRKFGQHFLSSHGILERIAGLVCSGERPRVLEIGPGRGALTERLLRCASHVTAVEIDLELVAYLRLRFPDLELIAADALEVDLAHYTPDIIAGNLPYYVATALIERTVRMGLPGVFLIQKEVAQRLTARPGSRDYGFLTVQTQLFATAELMFTVPPGAFRPPPKVDSAVVRLTPHPPVDDADGLLQFLSACFRQKRKTLRNNLRGSFPIEGQPEASMRAEQLSLDELTALWHRVSSNGR
jgi:16S rRNA (adenine1518-N6/adenine1519-N6)-dimethyltransferase